MARKNQTKKPTINITNVTISQNNREYKGIKEYRNALKSAENIHNPRRKLLYELYEEIVLDSHLSSVIDKRMLNVLGTPVKYFTAGGKEDETIKKIIGQKFFEQFLKHIIEARLWGYSLSYFEKITPEETKYELLPRKNVIPERSLVVNNTYDDDGLNYTEPPYSHYCVSVGNAKDLGLLIKAAPNVIYKKGDVADWATFAEIFGAPLRKGTYDGNDEQTRLELEKSLQNAGNASYVIFPKQADVDFVESGSKSGSSNLYKHLAEFMDKQNSKLILLNTMTTDAEGGNYKGETHENSEKKVMNADRKLVLDTLNDDFIRILRNFGFKVDGHFAFDDPDTLTLKDYLDMKREGIHIDDDFFYERFNIPKPKTKPEKKQQENSKKELNETVQTPIKQDLNANKKEERNAFLRFFDGLFSSFPRVGQPRLGEQLNNLYPTIELSDDTLMSTDLLISKALANIFTGATPAGGIDPNLWQITFSELNKAVDEGFGIVNYGQPNFEFIQQLKVNNGVFSAFKNHHQTSELVSLLRDNDGNLKSFAQFRKDAAPIIGKYNNQWLQAEYNTAVRSARTASRWKKWETTKHLYPNLVYLPSRAAEPRPEHAAFYHTVLPLEHPWWNTHTPPLDWNCLCGIDNTNQEATDVPADDVPVAEGLDHNPAKTGRLFSDSHPYNKRVPKRKREIVSRATEKLLRNSVRRWAKEFLVESKTAIYRKELQYPITFTNTQIKSITGKMHPERSHRDFLLLNIGEVMESAELLNTTPIAGETPNKKWYYFKVMVQGKESYVNVFEDVQNKKAQIHAISAFKPI